MQKNRLSPLSSKKITETYQLVAATRTPATSVRVTSYVVLTLRETERLGSGCQKSNQFLVMVMGICCKILGQIHETVHELSCLQAFPHFRPCDLDL